MPPDQQPDYISTADKLRDKLKWKPLNDILMGITIGFGLWIMVATSLQEHFYTPDDKRNLKIIDVYSKVAKQELQNHKISLADFKQYMSYLQQKKKNITSKYSIVPLIFPINILHSSYYHKKRLFLLMLLSDLLVAGTFIFLVRRKIKSLDAFFFPPPIPETALKLPEKSKRTFFTDKIYTEENDKKSKKHRYSKKLMDNVFSDFDKFIRLLDSGIKYKKYDESAVRKIIDEGLIHMIDYATKFYDQSLDLKKFELYSECLLWHYVVSLMGNCPTG
ncbi:MAG TPA: hypothetical protein ENO30_06950, partial [Thermodesulfobium narugense]|nr:hypothetical protein [Thermodesulfobium narugense]